MTEGKKMIKLYNSLTRKIEPLKPIKPGQVGMYTCGPTVYDHTHLGHMRTYTNNDLLRRMLEYNGLKVKQVINVTDVGHLRGDRDMGEDKMEAAAKKKRKSAFQIAREYEKEFFEVMAALNILKPHIICRATEHIELMIDLVRKIEEAGYAYPTSDGIYFDTAKFKRYNQLSHLPLKELQEGARVEKNQEKKTPTDFALWKFTPKGVKRQMEWPSPWAKKSFPGWHIECSAMSIEYLGDRFDIHTGGVDHINVHHTNEIAQNQTATGHRVVNLWFHNEFLLVNNQKMAKSLGNFFTSADLEERKINPLAMRYLFLTAHYRKRLNFTWKSARSAVQTLETLRGLVRQLKKTSQERSYLTDQKLRKGERFRFRFQTALNTDLNIPQALAVVWEMLKSNIPSYDKLDMLLDFDQVLGLKLALVSEIKIPAEVKKLAERRLKLRNQKKWEESDKVRQEIAKKGFTVEDNNKGYWLKPNQ